MTHIESITLEVNDLPAAEQFYAQAFGLGELIRLRASNAPTSGFRGFTASLVVAQPADVDALMEDATTAGATTIKPGAKSLWGYGGSVEAPDGTIWTIATSSKKNTGPASREFGSFVLVLGVDDVAATKKFYVDQGLTVGRSFGRKYVEFEAGAGRIQLALNKRKALAKNAGVPADGDGSHRLSINGSGSAGSAFSDPDGFAWEPALAQSDH